MKVSIFGKQLTVRESLRDMVEKKLAKFDKFFGADTEALVSAVIRGCSKKLIIDADGINIVSRNIDILKESDADVLLHAIADSLLGAAALGDIGKLFPDSDEKYKGSDSLVLLSEVAKRLCEAGYRVVNVDSTVIAQAPKIAPHIAAMRENIARALKISVDSVSVKATTEEGLGFTGAREGAAAHAVAMVGAL